MDIERYQRQKLLGKGPMSIVWLAHDVQTQQQVALKIMTAVTTDDKRNQKAGERFMREIKISQSLQHPNILPIIDQGYVEYNGHSVPYHVTPFMKDGSLADVIEQTPPWEAWTLVQTADAISQAAESLEYLHTRNPHIVHEDVKPANFLVYVIGKPQRMYHLYLCDFGISRWQQPNMMASDVLGTLVFMAPEQTQGEVTPASDQYSLALMACLMLTGKLPIQGATNDELLYAHLNELPLVPSEINPERIRSEVVDDIFLRALDKDPTRRFPSITAFSHALEQAIAIYAEAESNAKTQFLDASALSTLPLPTHKTVETDMDNNVVDEAFRIAVIPTDFVEHAVLDEPLPEKPQKSAVITPVPRGIQRPLHMQDVARYTLPARPKYFEWSSNGNMLACVLYSYAPFYLTHNELMRGGQAGQGGQAVLHPIAITNATQAGNLSWSPDNRVIAIAVRNEVRFWDIASNIELPLVISVTGRNIDGMDWSRRGQLALWTDTTLLLYSLTPALLASHQPPVPLRLSTNGGRSGGTGGIGILRWSPDGSQLLAGTSNGSLYYWDVPQDTFWQPMHAGQKVNSIAWSPDGAWFAAALRNNEVVVWETRGRHQVTTWSNLPSMPRSLSISIEGRLVIASSEHTLLSGTLNELSPSATLPGQLLASWSPQDTELVALDELHENVLVVWQE